MMAKYAARAPAGQSAKNILWHKIFYANLQK